MKDWLGELRGRMNEVTEERIKAAFENGDDLSDQGEIVALIDEGDVAKLFALYVETMLAAQKIGQDHKATHETGPVDPKECERSKKEARALFDEGNTVLAIFWLTTGLAESFAEGNLSWSRGGKIVKRKEQPEANELGVTMIAINSAEELMSLLGGTPPKKGNA